MIIWMIFSEWYVFISLSNPGELICVLLSLKEVRRAKKLKQSCNKIEILSVDDLSDLRVFNWSVLDGCPYEGSGLQSRDAV